MDRGDNQGSGEETRSGRISSAPGLSKRLEKARVRVARTHVKKQLHDAAAAAAPNVDRITLPGGQAEPGDKRAAARLEVSLPLQLRRAGAQEASDDRCRDLTPTGMFIATGEPLTLGSIIAFECNYGLLRRFGGMARVVWARQVTNAHGPRGVGVCFLDLDGTGVEAIEFVMKHSVEHPDAVPTARLTPQPFGSQPSGAARQRQVRAVTPTSSVIVDADMHAAAAQQVTREPAGSERTGFETRTLSQAAGPTRPQISAPQPPPASATAQIVADAHVTDAVAGAPTLRFERPDLPASQQPSEDAQRAWSSTQSGVGQGPTSDGVGSSTRTDPSSPVKLENTATSGSGYRMQGTETTVVRSSVPPDRATLRGHRSAAGSKTGRTARSTAGTAARPAPGNLLREDVPPTVAPMHVVGDPAAHTHDNVSGKDMLGRTLMGTPPMVPASQPRPVVLVSAGAVAVEPSIVIDAEPPPLERAMATVDADGVLVDSGELEAYVPTRGDDTQRTATEDDNDPVWRRQRLAELVAMQSETAAGDADLDSDIDRGDAPRRRADPRARMSAIAGALGRDRRALVVVVVVAWLLVGGLFARRGFSAADAPQLQPSGERAPAQ